MNAIVAEVLLALTTPKAPVSLRFPVDALETLFPKMYPEVQVDL